MGAETGLAVRYLPMGGRVRLALAGLGGAAGALGHAPFGLWALALVGLATGLALTVPADGARAAFRAGWAFGAGYFLVALHWIVEPFLVDIARHGWMAPFALILMAGGLALFWGAGAALASWSAGPRAGPARRLAALAAWLTLAEICRALVLTGFPWTLVGGIWIDTPAAMMGALVGPYGLTLATWALAALLAFGPLGGTWRGAVGALAVAVLAVTAAFWAGRARVAAAAVPPGAEAPVIRIIQPNAAQHLKWDPDYVPVFMERKLALTAEDGPVAPDAVVWPEVSLPYLLDGSLALQATISEAAKGAPVFIGAQRIDVEGRLLNSMAVLADGGAAARVYDKHHLVPFGEYFPGGMLAAWLGLEGLATTALGGFSPGPGPRVLDLTEAGLGHVLPLICYEAIFPRYAQADGIRADWMVQVTNDAWFGTFAGPQQHLDQARMRAIEQGVPLVRSANTGISAVIDPAGRLVAALPLGESGALDVALPSALPPTPFARTGSWPVFGLLLLALAGFAATRTRFRD
ncbi:MAG: apolipoprotein N-acyltransferase [Pseudomonadota bacterium]